MTGECGGGGGYKRLLKRAPAAFWGCSRKTHRHLQRVCILQCTVRDTALEVCVSVVSQQISLAVQRPTLSLLLTLPACKGAPYPALPAHALCLALCLPCRRSVRIAARTSRAARRLCAPCAAAHWTCAWRSSGDTRRRTYLTVRTLTAQGFFHCDRMMAGHPAFVTS